MTVFSLLRFASAELPLGVAWTLFHEVAFYLLFSLLILHRQLGLMAFALVTLASIVLFQYPGDGVPTALNVYTSAANFYFLLGMGACLLYRRAGSGATELALATAMILLVGIGGLDSHRLAPLLLVTGFALFLAGLTKLESAGRVRVPGVLVYIGDASYSAYLLHIPLSGLLLKVLINTQIYNAMGPDAAYFMVLLGTIALSCVAYSLVEKRLLTALRRDRQPNVVFGVVSRARAASPAASSK